MFYDDALGKYCDCISERGTESPSQCRSCHTTPRYQGSGWGTGPGGCTDCRCSESCDAPGCPAVITQKRIWKQVRAASSSYVSNLAALTVHGGQSNQPRRRWNMVNWNQMSDRAVPHHGTAYNPSRGNSTRATLVRHRPGAGAFAGVGVDVKHGSYARYLNRLKARSVRTQKSSCDGSKSNVTPKYGNKRRKIGMVASAHECC